ncbi:MAG: FAD-dependent oxidoreductase [Thermoleophilaceae bacterium]
MRATVVGCGFSGLSCAVRLLEAGFEVTVVAREAPGETVSAVAGGLWLPYEVGPLDRVAAWGAATYRELEARGAELVDALLLGAGPPWWADALPAGRVRVVPEGVLLTAPLVETPRYLDGLLAQVRELGGGFERRVLGELGEATGDLVVNCAGLGARELCGDAALEPVRGVVVHVRPRAGARPRTLVREQDLAYVLPRGDVCILGGSAERGAREATTDSETVAGILERCRALEPELEGCEVLGAHAGLRPARTEVRLEAERMPDGRPLIHDYGHGGGGLTLSWGCADEVAGLAAGLTGR